MGTKRNLDLDSSGGVWVMGGKCDKGGSAEDE